LEAGSLIRVADADTSNLADLAGQDEIPIRVEMTWWS